MKRKLSVLGIGMVALLLAGPTFAADNSPGYGDKTGSQINKESQRDSSSPSMMRGDQIQRDTTSPGMRGDQIQRDSSSPGMREDQIQRGSSSAGMRGSEQFVAENLKNVDDIKGRDVLDADGNNIGKIENVLVDSKTGRVEYITLTSGGMFGVGVDKYMIPWRALQTGTGQDEKIQLNLSAEKLKNAPKGDQLPSQAQSRELHQFYGVSPEWQENK